MNRRTSATIAVRTRLGVVAVALILAACAPTSSPAASATGGPSESPDGTPASTAAGEAIIVGALNPLTGEGGAYGAGMAAAIKIAVEEVNAAGGPLGRTVEVVYEDDATDPDQAVRGAEKLINVDGAQAILGTWASSSTLAVAPLTIEAGVIEMNTSGNPDITTLDDNDTVFRTGGSDKIQGAVIARAMYEQGTRRITILANQQAGTIGAAEAFQSTFEEEGGEVIELVVYADNQPSYRTEIQQVLATDPELVFLAGYQPDATIILREAFELGADVSWLSQLFAVNQQVVDTLGPEPVEGVQTYDLVADEEAEAYARLKAAYEDETGAPLLENIYAPLCYDQVILYALGVEMAGTTDGPAVGQAILEISRPPGEKVFSFAEGVELLREGMDIDYDGASGPIDFDDTGDQTPVMGIWQIVSGEFEFQGTSE